MNCFFSDMDNTLIYSYRRQIGEDKLLVEQIGQKEISYMTRKSSQLLESLKEQVEIIPVTTRSLEQYRRIKLSKTWKPKYALVANGGILLENNRIVESWYQESLRLIEDTQEQLEKGIELLREDVNVVHTVEKVEQLFVYTKSNQVERTLSRLRTELDLTNIDLVHHRSKLYILPKKLHKGVAVCRMKEQFDIKDSIAAGDSIFDLSMLEEANIALVPLILEEQFGVHNKNKVILKKEQVYSDELLDYIYQYCMKK